MTDTAYLILDEASGRYTHGPALTRITNDVLDLRTRFRDIGQTYLHELVERTGETANLAILDGLHAAYLDQVHTSRMLRAQTYLRVPLDCSGTGKVLLAFQTETRVRDAILRRLTLQRCTEHSPRTLAELRGRLATIRETGIGLDDEEMELGVRCIAAPVMVGGTIVAAISIAGPATRVSNERLDDLSAVVRDVASPSSPRPSRSNCPTSAWRRSREPGSHRSTADDRAGEESRVRRRCGAPGATPSWRRCEQRVSTRCSGYPAVTTSTCSTPW